MAYGDDPAWILEKKERAKLRNKYKCLACVHRPKEVGGQGTCSVKGNYRGGGRCGFDLDPDFKVNR